MATKKQTTKKATTKLAGSDTPIATSSSAFVDMQDSDMFGRSVTIRKEGSAYVVSKAGADTVITAKHAALSFYESEVKSTQW